MSRKIIVVDDNAINRQLLIMTLSAEYDVIEADGGAEALRLINGNYKTLSAILTDVQMPEIDGYEVLRRVRENPALSSIPVIIVTGSEDEQSRTKALTLGANDFLTKPFSPEIVKHCVKNNIALRETAQMLNAIQKDKLTGLYNREAFFGKADAAIKDRAPGYYMLSCFDIDNFKLVNDQFGNDEGDRILHEIGRTVAEDMEKIGGIGGRISGDNFAVLIPADKKEMSIANIVAQNRMAFSEKQAIVFSVGRYVISDVTLSASAIYDRAFIAKLSVKGRYDTHIAYFDDEMLDRLIRSQQIAAEMDAAVAERQFEVWFQPQRNHATGSLVGAEALVRWRHPSKGLIPPYEFIPVFEKNGSIYELDKYVWKEVCSCLRRWIDEGRNPTPVSVNVSRIDMFHIDFVEVITGLVREYRLPEDLLRLEITESAFSQSTKKIVEIVQQLIDNGFTVEIDDFGSGYSSLNTLKCVPAQVVKLDMRFLEDNDDSGRGGNILESIVRMTKWLGMSVIAEGVETKQQADYLTSVGCSYIQGYLYARPMPVSDYEEYCENEDKESRLLDMETIAHMDNNSFWSPESMDTLIFNRYIGSACIFEYYNGHIELLRSNAKFRDILGFGVLSLEDTLKLNWISHLTPESLALVRDILQRSAADRKEYTNEYTFLNITKELPVTCLRSTMRVIATTGDRMLVYCTSENITELKAVEQRERDAYEQIQLMIHDMPGGYAQMQVHPDGHLSLTYFNDTFCYLRGMSHDALFEAEGADAFRLVYPDDAPIIMKTISELLPGGGTANIKYRLKCGDGKYKWFSVFGRESSDKNGDTVINAYYTDIDTQVKEEEAEKALMDNLPVGAGIYEFNNGQMSLTYQNKVYWELVGLNEEAYPDASEMSAIHPDDIPTVMQELSSAIGEHSDVACDIRLRHLTRGYRPVSLSGRVALKEKGRFLIYATFTPISDVVMEARNQQARLTLLTNSIPGGIAAYEGKPEELDKIRLTYFSDGFCRLFGYSREEYEKLAERNPLSLVTSGDVANIHKSITALVRDGIPMDFVYRSKVKSGEIKWINVKAVMGEPADDKLTVNAVFFDVTTRMNALEKLRISDEINRLAIRQSMGTVSQYDIASRRLTVSENTDAIFEREAVEEDIPYKPVRENKVSEDTADAYIAFYESILHGEKKGVARFQRSSTQGWRWIEAHFTTIFSDRGEPITAVISIFDITETIEKEAAYRKWKQSIREKDPKSYSLYRCNVTKSVLTETSDGTLIPEYDLENSMNLEKHNANYADVCVFAEDRQRFLAFINRDAMLLRYSQGRRTDTVEYRKLLPDGKTRWLRLSVDFVDSPYSSEIEAYMLFENIDAAKRAELALIDRAEKDPLTGVLSRSSFIAKVGSMLEKQNKEAFSALYIIDLDGFKQINDSFGHAAGDETLIEIGQKLCDTFRGDDLICRLGGDEFIVYMGNVTHMGAVKERAALLCALLHKSFSLEIQLSASIGISISPDNGTDFETLYQKADAALYHIKENGKDGYALYTESMAKRERSHEAAAAEKTTVSDTVYRKPKPRMLIVDDNEINRDYLTALFEDDYLIDTAAEGTAALIRLNRYGAGTSVVLLDLMMPGISGFDVLKKMRESVTMQSIPVIVVSGMNERETALEAIKAGASDYITKPVDADLLKLRVSSAISKSENEQLRAQNRYLAMQNEEAKRLAEARRHSEELSVALHAAEKADLAKSQFLSSMSHEIRTPLNAVIGYNTIARSEMNKAKTDEERKAVSMKVLDCLTKSEVASRHLLTIINDVLDMSAIESGKLRVDDSPFDFRGLITSLTVMFYSQAKAKGVSFEVLFDKPTEEWFVGDQLRINQVLTNLLSNAVKFTPEGGNVTLNITEKRIDDKTVAFTFAVSDTGIGMTQEYLTHIWTPFEQAEASISRRFGGSGLGLSITKNLVDLMGGTITVESKSGEGSKFTVELALTRTEQPQNTASVDFSKLNAIVVDDDYSTCDYIKLLFDRCGARCTTFTSGGQALSAFAEAKAKGEPFNMCLVDWRMPKMDGFTTISEIRRIAAKDLPIVVVTAYDFDEIAAHTESLGINRFISKPLFQSSLFDLLATVCGQQTVSSAPSAPRYDFDGARILLVEDNNMNMEVAKHVLLSAKLAVDCAWNGQEAVDIFSASKPGTYKAILMDVHMPVIDGYQATRMIRATGRSDSASTPIIAMTADVFIEDVEQAHSAGMNDHISKPVDVETLYTMLTKYMGDNNS